MLGPIDDRVSSGGLCCIGRCIGVVQKTIAVIATVGKSGDAEARRHPGGEDVNFCDRSPQLFGNIAGVSDAGVRQNNGEFFSAQASDDIAFSDVSETLLGCSYEDIITPRM